MLSFRNEMRAGMDAYGRTFEIWVCEGVSVSVCPAGPAGEPCRAMNEPGSRLAHVYTASSELDQMQQYYDYMGFGIYTSHWPELAARPYHFVDALEHLGKLKTPLLPLMEISVMADGSTQPPIPNPLPRILLQDRAVFAVDIWIRGDYGGHGKAPINEADLITLAQAHLRQIAPQLLHRDRSTFLICPMEIAIQMQWPADGRDSSQRDGKRGDGLSKAAGRMALEDRPEAIGE